jgi:hypothetical protein
MDGGTVKQLAQLKEEPAVSILCPLDAHRPGNVQDPAVLAVLRDRAVENVNRVLHGRAAASLIARIDEALGSVDLQHPSLGVAVLVSPNVSHVIALDAPVGPHVVVGERFAIRDLVTAMLRRKCARIVVLSLAKTRCIDLTGDDALERLDFGFPVEVVPPTEADAPHGDFPLSEHEHAEAAKFVFRAVDRSLGALQQHDRRPLVLVGTERDLAYFDEVTEHGAHVVGRVPRNHERDTPDELAQLVQPTLEEHEWREQQHVCDEAREAIGTHAVSGIADTWLAARAGRGHRLVVEDGYRFPAHLVAETLTAAPDGEASSFDAAADTVEEVVRHDGDVVVVPAGSLADLGHVALLTRY